MPLLMGLTNTLLVGDAGTLLISADAIHWTAGDIGTQSNLHWHYLWTKINLS